MWVSRHIRKALRRFADDNDRRTPRTGYVIYSGSYVGNSAGVQCLHRLCGELNARGYPAFVAGGTVAAPHLNAPMIELETAHSLCADGFCAIYPETVSGNLFGAAKVVRWVLNRPALLGGDREYADGEAVFTYSDVYSPYISNLIAGKLYMPTIDEGLFFCEENDLTARSLECFYVGKSQWRDGIINSSDTIEITRENPHRSELGKLFRAAKVLYCFDNSTILIYEALFCGCPVVVIPDGTHTQADFARLELGTSGISWGVDEQVSKRVDLTELKSRYDIVKRQFLDQLTSMIAISQANSPADIEWSRLASKYLRKEVTKRVRRAPGQFVQTIDRYSRNVERAIRKGRRYCLGQRRENCIPYNPLRDSGKHFFDTRCDAARRRLQCFTATDCIDTGVFDRSLAFEIAPATPAKELGKLFRVSRRYFTFQRQDPLIECALRCGCPVTIIGRGNEVEQIDPSPEALAVLR